MGLSQADIAHFPVNAQTLEKDTQFTFSCHSGLKCFTECCRLLELALTPYDVLRLRRATGLSSTDFLEKFVIIEHPEGEVFPRLYLTMIDDGRASCVFVSALGCTVYQDRPGACRAYPLGRGASRHNAAGSTEEHYILIQEPHCHGFLEQITQTAEGYCLDQGLSEYNRFNDEVASILQHPQVRRGKILQPEERELFLLFLYDLDRLRIEISGGMIPDMTPITVQKVMSFNDPELLLFAIQRLRERLFD
ncbi:YkgJ family cysteine cluster protein [Desulfoprunum benzoelyticum]|uniref:Fe-S oxidoreductase n=1 Tax=Desulfoprunum benzoelyticum TaxID=1506996 RepID=A0A840UU36_9BACT|nr:YkgJ family cysteine cluster protein [Desulfoprunum benzoelyticum]MBB5346904.1 hypothetical protein [Desulfoprunum benzoelyticum]MBM9529434.1 YkgJ family cysteine cluster protein [Desulfoprunum benzoelyticum]